MTMFIELLAPPLCAACVSFGGLQGGLTAGPVDLGIGSINQRQADGQIEHDTVFVSSGVRLVRAGRFSAGAFAAVTFNPTPEGGPRTVQAGPWGEFRLTSHIAVRAYGIPDLRSLGHSQVMFGVRLTP